mmetsp:Transcript_71045/g.125604  ORF Transcript_71045/g.125604 Transcript_71045/m.125604 type:complete len:139 (+) Transcript_71045:1-417(+)
MPRQWEQAQEMPSAQLGPEQLQQVTAEAIQAVLQGQHGDPASLPPRPPPGSATGRRPSSHLRSHSPAAGQATARFAHSPTPPATYRSVDSPKVRQVKAAAAAAAAAALAAEEHLPTEAWSEDYSEPDMDADVGRAGWY